jgi:hypothetical protein
MGKIKSALFNRCLLCLCLACSACAGSPASNTDAQASALAAQAELDRQLGGGGAPAAPQSKPTGKARPAWVDSVNTVYDRRQYVAAVGYAADRALAEKNALANLAAIFGQSVYADQKVINTYREGVKNGAAAEYTGSTDVQNKIQTSASMDTLIGAEIGDIWFDGKGVYYAAAVMDKAKTTRIYSDMIQANQTMIANLIDMSRAEKNSLQGFSRYQFAAAAADMNTAYGNVLRVIGAAPPAELKTGDTYRFEARAIAGTIPVKVTVKGDKAGRIQGAFAKALSGLGFRSLGDSAGAGAVGVGGGVGVEPASRYALEADFTLSDVSAEYPNPQNNKYCRYAISANLVDTDTVSGKTALLPYNISGREGHTTPAGAENRAITEAVKEIETDYKARLSDYLSQLLPKK